MDELQDDQNVYYQAPSTDEVKNVQLQPLMEERVGQYYLYKDNKVIAIPPGPTPEIIENKNEREKDENVEKSLHYEIVRILRNGDMQSLTILNFNTNDLARKNTQKEVNFLLIPVFHFLGGKFLSYRLGFHHFSLKLDIY